jgi:DNA-binding phage protein
MPRRSKDWNKGLAQDLRNPKFAQEFILSAVDEGVLLQTILGKVVRAYGIKEFSKKVDLPSSNVVRAVHPRHRPTQETMNRLLRPFGLELSVAPIRNLKSAA